MFKNWFQQWQIPAAGLLLISGLLGSQASLAANLNQDKTNSASSKLEQSSQTVSQLADGIYVYGESAQPQELGKEYLVFEVKQGQVNGAFYMPSSEFSCFVGQAKSDQLNLLVMNPPGESALEQQIALEEPQSVAAASSVPHAKDALESTRYPYAVTLQGYHRLSEVSKQDQQILQMCQPGNPGS